MNKIKQQFSNVGYTFTKPESSEFEKLIDTGFTRATSIASSKNSNFQKKWTHASGKSKHLVNVHRSEEIFRDIMTSKQLRDFVFSFMEEDAYYITHSKLSLKHTGIDQEWLPHQDSAYKLRVSKGVTIAVFLEDCNKLNGTIKVIPESHKLGRLPHSLIYIDGEKDPQVKVKHEFKTKPVDLELDKSSIAAFNLDTVHLSGPNNDKGHRCILIFELEPLGILPYESDGTDAIIITRDGSQPKRPAIAPIAKAVLSFSDKVLRPAAKKALYLKKHLSK